MANAELSEKMLIVVKALQDNPDLVPVAGIELDHLTTDEWPKPRGRWFHTLDIYTAPKSPIYDRDELNEFLYGLVPDVALDGYRDFRGGRRGDATLKLGVLHYDDDIGIAELSAAVKLNRNVSLVSRGKVSSEWGAEEVLILQQRTTVILFPDINHMADASNGINPHEIPMPELGRRAGGLAISALLRPITMGRGASS